ncbi:MAG TPA: YtxH domain-containing protein [Terriglobia bacterium]|nr:YtxH domain-containing protein [Terriglobia bacterium]
MSENKVGSKFGFFLAGLGVGAVVALLFAPTSGEEAREFLGKKADEGRDYVTAKSRQLRRQAGGLVDKARDLVA